MRFDVKSPPTPAHNWRWILWAASLVPVLLLLMWSVRSTWQRNQDLLGTRHSVEDAQRLHRILSGPLEEQATQLRHDAVRVVSNAESNATQIEIPIGESTVSVRGDAALLSVIDDNRFGVSVAEKSAYDELLAKVCDFSSSELERIARRDVPFAVLMLNANNYRGQVLTVEGDVRRLNRIPSRPGMPVDAEHFEAWLFTSDSGLNPYRIILSELPEAMPTGNQLDPPVRVRATGYFFKRYSYATSGDFHTAPLLLAKTLIPLAAKSTSQKMEHGSPSGQLAWAAFAGLSFLTVAWFAFSRPTRRRTAITTSTNEPPDFRWLTSPTQPPVEKETREQV